MIALIKEQTDGSLTLANTSYKAQISKCSMAMTSLVPQKAQRGSCQTAEVSKNSNKSRLRNRIVDLISAFLVTYFFYYNKYIIVSLFDLYYSILLKITARYVTFIVLILLSIF